MEAKRVLSAVIIEGTVRSDRQTKRLLRSVAAGDIALLQHADLDEQAAVGLVAAGVKAVVNAAPTMTGSFPHEGPLELLRNGIPIFEIAAAEFDRVGDGRRVRIAEGMLVCEGRHIRCSAFGYDSWLAARRTAERSYRQTVLDFTDNTLRYAKEELDTLLTPLRMPPLDRPLAGEHALIVSRGRGHREDLSALREYIAAMQPALIGVDGGADALAAQGYLPDLIVGDMDSISDEALRCGAQLFVHAYADGHAPGMERIRALGLRATTVTAPGTSEDVALRIAYEGDAARLVVVGSHCGPVDFLQKGRKGMASTLLVRMLVGHKLVDARGAGLWMQPGYSPLARLQSLTEGGADEWTHQYR
ncbi:putative cytokinetic ring protein SteA [Paenibacillus hodogayensis]|uniref:Cytokinetic ring protein SteA n=1 Tax=Paenibacillus hodogayensis TaxID=279208 RepID=A0ABV5W505_9BACL